MSEQPVAQTPITAVFLAEQLAELSQLKEAYEVARQTCMGGDDPVSEAEFDAWLKSFGDLGGDEEHDFPRYRRCMEAYQAFAERSSYVQYLPLLGPHPAVAELAHMFPSLREAPGLAPFDEGRFEEWMQEEASLQAQYAARLVFSVWENMPQAFNLADAFRDWDEEHREAYVAWFRRPLMPQRELWGTL